MSDSFSQSVQDFLHLYLPIKTILSIGFIFGIYFPMQCSKLIINVGKLYCLLLSLIVPILSFFFANNVYPVTICLYFASAIWVAVFVEGKCLLQYRAAVGITNSVMGYTQQRIEIKISYVLLFLMIFTRFIFNITNFSGVTNVIYYILTFIHISIDFSNLTRMFLFEIFYVRIKLLRESFEIVFMNYFDNLMKLDEMICKVKFNICLYKQRLDDFQIISTRLQAMLYTAIVACFIHGVTQVKFILHLSENPALWDRNVKIGTTLFELVFRCLVTCVPALFTELSLAEVEK